MSARGMEKAVQVVSIPAIWLAFAAVWAAAQGFVVMHKELGSYMPCGSGVLLAMSESTLTFLVPAVLTVPVVWLMAKRSAHATWAAGTALGVGMLYAAVAHVAAAAPIFSLCRNL